VIGLVRGADSDADRDVVVSIYFADRHRVELPTVAARPILLRYGWRASFYLFGILGVA
jgi:hypothetical protein